jgi:hypothetical protein
MKRLIYCLLLAAYCLATNTVQSQGFIRRTIGGFIHDTSQAGEPRFLIYPTIAYSPETSLEIGFSSLYVYYANRDTVNRLSEISAFTFFTLRNQYGFWLDNALYSDQDKIFLLGKLRIQSFPLFYYGIGQGTPKQYQARVDANQIWIKERVLRKIKKNLFMGLELDFQRLSSVDFVRNKQFSTIELPIGSQGSTNFGVGLGVVYDNRHNVLNVRKGFFSEVGFLHYNKALSEFRFNNFISDTRLYRPLGKRNVIATQLLGQFNTGNIPFNQMALMGGESMMRGYYTGRFRDKNQIAAQTEIRFLPLPLGFSKRIGAAVFGAAATAFPSVKDMFASRLIFSGGAGLRFLLFPKKDIYTRLDYALTREGGGLYIFVGEAF